jgi:hypothetical protein
MSFFKNKKLLIVLFSIIAGIVLLMLILQFVIGGVLNNKLKQSISKNKNLDYDIAIEKVKFNLFSMTLILKDITIIPTDTLLADLKSKSPKYSQAYKLTIQSVRIRNIALFDYLFDKAINVGGIIISDAEVYSYKSINEPKIIHTTEIVKKPKPFKLDSIRLKKINGVNINIVDIKNFSFVTINLLNNDTTFAAKKLEINTTGIKLVKNKGLNSTFKLKLNNAKINLKNETINLPGGKYLLSFDSFVFDIDSKKLVVDKFKIKPKYSQSSMVSFSKFNKEVYDCEIKSIEIQSFNPKDIIEKQSIIIGNVLVDSMILDIFKDKRLPFDTLKRPQLPQILLANMKQDLNIDSILITNSNLVYSERHKSTTELMKVTLGNLNIKIANVTSILDSIVRGDLLTIHLNAKLQNTIPMGVNIYMPLGSISDTFSFNGWLGAGNMKLFNNILLPAIGIKFNGGELDGVSFTAAANSQYSIGKLTMLYHDLDGVVVRKDMEQTNKFISWAANVAMIRNNPIPNKEKRTTPMYFDRVMYKGMGNFLWKTLQSGITATIIPTMDNKVKKQVDIKQGTDKKTIRKREREEKHKNKKKNNKN